MRGYKLDGNFYCPDCVARHFTPQTVQLLRTEGEKIAENAPGGLCNYCETNLVGIDPEPDPSTVSWLLATATAPYGLPGIEAAIGFGAVVMRAEVVGFRTVALVRSPRQHAEWNHYRLATCLYGGHVYEDRADAETDYAILMK